MGERIKYIVNIVIVALLLASVAISKNGRVVGVPVKDMFASQESAPQIPIENTLSDGTRVVNTITIGKEVIGFGGYTPIDFHVKDGVITKVVPHQNNETPSFMQQISDSDFLSTWIGKSLSEAAQIKADAISGATITSDAISKNVQLAAQYASNTKIEASHPLADISLKEIAGVLVLLMGVVLTFAKSKSKVFMRVQMVLNVAVLGFWCGSFISLSTLVAWLSNGVNLASSLITLAMVIIIIAMPLFGKKGSYCHIHCPMGSAQELVSLVPIAKIKIKPSVSKVLNNLRYYILSALLLLMWVGVGFDLINYEVFSAFIYSSASTVVLVMAVVFLLLSLFIQRPYCRFVCPTGALITMSQKTKDNN